MRLRYAFLFLIQPMLAGVLVFSFINIAFAQQPVREWAPQGAVWFYTQEEFGPPEENYHRLTATRIDTIDGKVCRIIERAFFRERVAGKDRPYLCTYEADNKVYAMELDMPENGFAMIYDFAADSGDTLQVQFRGIPIQIVIDSIQYVDLGGEMIRGQRIHTVDRITSEYAMHGIIYDRIGNGSWILPQHGWADPPDGGFLYCYSDAFLSYNWDKQRRCDYLNATRSFEITLDVYPNPSGGQVQVVSDHSIDEIRVFDHLGRLVQSAMGYGRNAGTQFDLVFENPGVYFMVLKTGNEYITRKVLIQ